eukprot:493330-Pyramimonas_sp.AAC.1
MQTRRSSTRWSAICCAWPDLPEQGQGTDVGPRVSLYLKKRMGRWRKKRRGMGMVGVRYREIA